MTHRPVAWSFPALLSLLASVWVTTGSALAASPSQALVRVVWLSPGQPWQASMDTRSWLPSLQYQQVTDFQPVPAGDHQFEFRPGAASPAGVSVQASLQAGSAYTILGTAGAATGGGQAKTRLELIPDDALPMPGKAQVRVVQSDAMMPPTINTGLAQGDPALFARGIRFLGVTPFVAVDPGSYSGPSAIVCRDANSGGVIHPPLSVTLAPGSAQTFYEVGGMGGEPTSMKEVLVPELAAAAVSSSVPPPDLGGGGMALWPLELAMALSLGALIAWIARQTGRRRA